MKPYHRLGIGAMLAMIVVLLLVLIANLVPDTSWLAIALVCLIILALCLGGIIAD